MGLFDIQDNITKLRCKDIFKKVPFLNYHNIPYYNGLTFAIIHNSSGEYELKQLDRVIFDKHFSYDILMYDQFVEWLQKFIEEIEKGESLIDPNNIMSDLKTLAEKFIPESSNSLIITAAPTLYDFNIDHHVFKEVYNQYALRNRIGQIGFEVPMHYVKYIYFMFSTKDAPCAFHWFLPIAMNL